MAAGLVGHGHCRRAAGLVAKHAIEISWRKATGKEPPANPESPETTWTEAVGFAVLSGVVLGIARLAGPAGRRPQLGQGHRQPAAGPRISAIASVPRSLPR